MPQEHNIVEILKLDEIDHVGDVSFEVNFGACQVHPLRDR
jgi:hypothetical protein